MYSKNLCNVLNFCDAIARLEICIAKENIRIAFQDFCNRKKINEPSDLIRVEQLLSALDFIGLRPFRACHWIREIRIYLRNFTRPLNQPFGNLFQLLSLHGDCIIKVVCQFKISSHTVCGYKFNHLVAKLTTFKVSRSASFRGQPCALEERLKNKKCSQFLNQVPCF